jgi:hypothetical protein
VLKLVSSFSPAGSAPSAASSSSAAAAAGIAGKKEVLKRDKRVEFSCKKFEGQIKIIKIQMRFCSIEFASISSLENASP